MAISGTSGADFIDDDWPNRTISDAEVIHGLGGSDRIFGFGGHDTLNGDNGNDFLSGGAGNDQLNGGADTDAAVYRDARGAIVASLAGGAATGQGDDTFTSIENLIGSGFNDRLTGDNGNNLLLGLAGNDMLTGGDGHDRIAGGLGNDELRGGAGSDILIGRKGADLLLGEEGDDWVAGGRGNDELHGGDGNDIVRGGKGQDELHGGEGSDLFIFRYLSDSSLVASDTITDFNRKFDTIDLSLIDAFQGSGGSDFFFIGASACQSALDWDPVSAFKRDPFERRGLVVALAPTEPVGVAEAARARPSGRSSSRLLKRQLSLPVSTMSQ